MKSVTIFQPWLPRYRQGFYERLRESLEQRDVQLCLIHGTQTPEASGRGDAASLPWAQQVQSHFVGPGSRKIGMRWPVAGSYDTDLFITEQAIRNPELYLALAGRPIRPRAVGVWGHGRTYVKAQSPVESRLKAALTVRADRFFAYTDGGLRWAKDIGMPEDRVTVLDNTFDTVALRTEMAQISATDAEQFRRIHGLQRGSTALYIGGLDRWKRIDFLLASAARIAQQLPGFKLVLAGQGSASDLIRETQRHSDWLRWVGQVSPRDKALVARVADVMLVPGAIGLVAVDSLVLGVPIVTTDWPFHGPEFEYLTPGRTCVVTQDDIDAYSREVVHLLSQPTRLGSLREAGAEDSCAYSLDNMVTRMSEGIIATLRSAR